MANNTATSSILSEHRKVVGTRYLLAIVNFIVIFLGTVVTLFFVSRKGIYSVVKLHLYALLVINLLQIALAVTEHVLRNKKGINLRGWPIATNAVGVVWLVVLISELAVATLKLGTLRIDLLVIAVIQLAVALVAYLLWPIMDRRAVDAMIRPSVREDVPKREKKAKSFVRSYIIVSVLIVLLQVGTLAAYKMPPVFYDLFADTRALEYELNDSKDGYVVKAVYKGTSDTVNVPATYNNLPVVGIAKGALVDENVLSKYQIKKIVFGTETVNENGETVLKSNLVYLAEGAIVNNQIERLALPSSLNSVAGHAVSSTSLHTLEYSAAAEFKYESFAECTALTKVSMLGENVGRIVSLNGMDPDKVSIEVDKNIYNDYRKKNLAYVKSFQPILDEDEFCVDFFTDCEYYIDSIVSKLGQNVTLRIADLDAAAAKNAGPSISVDTLAYTRNPHEVGTNGAKPRSAFRGWYYDERFAAECKLSESETVTFTTGASLYAKWIDEYEAKLDWGTYKPAEQKTSVYWTEEDLCVFPQITDRVGYSQGLYWTDTESGNRIADSAGMVGDKALHATWLLDAPAASIKHMLANRTETEETTPNYAQFVYDETKELTLAAQQNHPLFGTDYTYEWIKLGDDSYTNQAPIIQLKNVTESGDYLLRVTAHAPLGETSVTEVDYGVRINKKPLDMGTARLNDYNSTYNALAQTVHVDGAVTSDHVKTTYRYYRNSEGTKTLVATNTGVKNAGVYAVEVLFEKDNAQEAANYASKTLTANMEIAPKMLTFVSWSQSEFTYNGQPRTVTMTFDGRLGADVINVIYEGNTQTNAGAHYRAVATAVSNSNYSLQQIQASGKHACDWRINPKTVTVQSWQRDGSGWNNFQITYDGNPHNVYAVPAGVVASDAAGFAFVYDTAHNSVNTATNAGHYKATVLAPANPNYQLDPEASVNREWEIVPKALAVQYITGNDLIYNGAVQSIEANITGFCGEDAKSFKLNMLNLTGNTATAATIDEQNRTGAFRFALQGKNAATYTANVHGLIVGGSNAFLNNYSLAEVTGKSFTIQKKLVTLSKQSGSLTYNGGSQEFLVYVDNIVAADLSTFAKEQFTTNAAAGRVEGNRYALVYRATNAGSYPISVSALAHSEGNYGLSGALDNTSFFVAKRELTVSKWQITDKAKGNAVTDLKAGGVVTYNYHGYRLNAVLSGAATGDTPILNYTANEKTVAGSYITGATLADPTNYTLRNAQISWTIQPYNLTVSWKVNGSSQTNFVYDGTAKTATPIYTLLGDDSISPVYSTDNRTRTAAGTSTTVMSDTGNSNYKLASGQTFSFTITPRPVTVVWNNTGNVVYNGTQQGPGFTLNNLVDADVAGGHLKVRVTGNRNTNVGGSYSGTYNFSVTALNSYSLSDTSFAVDAGTYNVTGVKIYTDSAENTNYTVTASTTSFKIAQKPLVLSGTWNFANTKRSGVYNDSAALMYNKNTYTLTTTVGSGPVQRLGGSVDSVTLLYSGNAGSAAGNYTATVTGLSGTYAGNYALPTVNVSAAWKIAPKPVSLVWTENSFVYDGNLQTQTAQIKSGGANDSDRALYANDTYNLTYAQNSYKNAGSYTAKVTSLNNANYVLDADSNTVYAWSIAKRPVSLKWEYASTVYNGAVQYPKATVNNRYGSDSVSVTSYSGNTSSKLAGSGYTVTATVLDNNNYTLAGGTDLSANYEIAKRTLTYQWYATNAAGGATQYGIDNMVYNGQDYTLLLKLTNLCGQDDVAPQYAGSHTVRNVGNSNYVFSASLTGEDCANYILPNAAMQVSVNVLPKPIEIEWTWDSNKKTQPTIVYDGQPHTLVATVKGLVGADVCGYDVAYGQKEATAAGTYTAEVRSLTNKNYTLTGAIGAKTANLTIGKRLVTLSWSGNTTYTYNGETRTMTATVTNLAGGDTCTVSYSGTRSASNAGTYTASVTSVSNNNYTVSGATGATTSMTINKQTVTVTWGSTSSFVYDGTAKSLTVTGKDAAGNAVPLTASNNQRTAAGSQTVTVKPTDTVNYALSTNTQSSRELTVTKATLGVNWSGAGSYTYNDNTTRTLTATLTGKIGSDVVNPSVSGTTSAKSVGTYTARVVSLTGSAAANYQLSNVGTSATLTIVPQRVSVQWSGSDSVVYDGQPHDRRPTVRGLDDSRSVSFNFQSASQTEVGKYTYQLTDLSDKNYTLSNAEGDISVTMTIAPRPVNVQWGDTAQTAGNTHAPTATVTNTVKDEEVTLTFSGPDDYEELAAGNYELRVTALSGKNAAHYTLEGATGKDATLTVEVE